jgi:ABC-type oligopeptide transport system substrate-binding subunit
LVFHAIGTVERSRLEFELGRIDLVEAGNDPKRDPSSPGGGVPQTISSDHASLHALGFNVRNPFLADREHRRALAGALDRALAVRVLVPRRGRLAAGIVPPVLRNPGTDPGVRWWPGPQESARQARSFAPSAPPLSLWVPEDVETSQRLAEFVASTFRRLGYRITVVRKPREEFERGVRDGRADLFDVSRDASTASALEFLADLVDGRRRGLSGNWTWYANPTVDAALDNARFAATPEPALRRAERTALEDAALVPFFHGVNVVLARPGIDGIELLPLGPNRYDAVEVGDAR